jgi:hypothetical protein
MNPITGIKASTIIHAKVADGDFLSLKITVKASIAFITYTKTTSQKDCERISAMSIICLPYPFL